MSDIKLSNLSKTYGPYTAVDGLSLEIPAGCVFGLLGPNGAGKTTTFKCMLGLAQPTGGSVFYDGKPLSPETFADIAYVPERSVLYEWMTVTDHLEMERRAFTNFDPKRALELLAGFNVDPRKRVRQLSKGMRTATMAAMAFARDAGVLILDEPTSGLDPVNQRTVLSLIINEAAKGRSIIFSSHQIGQVERAAERIAVMNNGRLVLEGTIDDLKADRKVVEGIFPSESYSLNGFANDARIGRIDRTERIVRILALSGADDIARHLGEAGATGIRILDLNLEDIFLFAVSPADSQVDVVTGAVQ
jgi:ABC-2 type transport system ATP-binding protein